MQQSEVLAAQARARLMLADAGIQITSAESAAIEVADLQLNRLSIEGLQLLTYFNDARYCAKELVLFPRQTCPEHRHPPVHGDAGKQETFRCRNGVVYLYVEGPRTHPIQARIPEAGVPFYTVFHEHILHPGDQHTIPPNTLHWFQAGPEGAIVSEFSSTSRDAFDVFTNPNIRRATVVDS